MMSTYYALAAKYTTETSAKMQNFHFSFYNITLIRWTNMPAKMPSTLAYNPRSQLWDKKFGFLSYTVYTDPCTRRSTLRSDRTQVHFSGALPIRISTCKRRLYILLLTCAITRSIHLGALLDMTTEGLLLALRRFMTRKGTPSVFISDNAFYFQAADRRIQSMLQSSEFQHYMTNQEIVWRFIPESTMLRGFLGNVSRISQGLFTSSIWP